MFLFPVSHSKGLTIAIPVLQKDFESLHIYI